MLRSVLIPLMVCLVGPGAEDVAGQCVGGFETFEKTSGMTIISQSEGLLEQPGAAVTEDCAKVCLTGNSSCKAFTVDYNSSRCEAFADSIEIDQRGKWVLKSRRNFFQKVCYEGVPQEELCDQKLWAFERVVGAFLEGFDDKEVKEIQTKIECSGLCLKETEFICRSVEFDHVTKTCRLSREDRHSQPNALKKCVHGSTDYFENQCAKQEINWFYKKKSSILEQMDDLQSTVNIKDCLRMCTKWKKFYCFSVTFDQELNICRMSATGLNNVSRESINENDTVQVFYKVPEVSANTHEPDVLLTIDFETPFSGLVYATGDPVNCLAMGKNSTRVLFRLSLGRKCHTIRNFEGNYINHLVFQEDPLVLRKSDTAIRIDIITFNEEMFTVSYAKNGEDAEESRPFNISGKAMAENEFDLDLRMGIWTRYQGQLEYPSVALGEFVQLKLEIEGVSKLGIFVRSLYARSENEDVIPLLDSVGCPKDPSLFSGFEMETGTKNLVSVFKAFRFPSKDSVRFVAEVEFCYDVCPRPTCVGESFNKTVSQGETTSTLPDLVDPDPKVSRPLPTPVTLSTKMFVGVSFTPGKSEHIKTQGILQPADILAVAV